MSRGQKIAVVVAALLLILLLFLLQWPHRAMRGRQAPAPGPGQPPLLTSSATLPAPSPTAPVPPAVPHHGISPVVSSATHPSPASPAPTVPTPVPLIPAPSSTTLVVPAGQEGMHRELIPKNITIERCYYTEEVVNPGTQFYFDINGSGFDNRFYNSISVDPDALDIEVQNLTLVTANQIRGLMVVGDAATTQYIYPKIVIRGLPVFRAPEPFGVVRRGEVLDIHLTSIDDTGQWGKFRIITNLDNTLYPRLSVQPTTTHLDVSDLKPQLPFYVDGTIEIAPGLASGSYGLRVLLGNHEIFQKKPLVDVVRPNIGKSGSIENVQAVELAHRPGDTVEFVVEGSGFQANQVANLTAKIDTVPTSPATFTFASAGKYTMALTLPSTIAKGVYSVTIESQGKPVFQKKAAFAVVPPDWLSQVQLTRPLLPGQTGEVQLIGRDLSPAFLSQLRVDVDDPGLKVSPLRLSNDRTIAADLQVSTGVAPGDYIIHVYKDDKELRLPRGNIIKIQ